MTVAGVPAVSQMSSDQKLLWNNCQQLEQAFLEMLLKQMSQTGLESSLLPKTMQSEIYRDMQQQQLAAQMAKSGGIGLASTLYRQLQRQLPAQSPVSQ